MNTPKTRRGQTAALVTVDETAVSATETDTTTAAEPTEVVEEIAGVATVEEQAEVAAAVAGSYEAEVAALVAAGNTNITSILTSIEGYIAAMNPLKPMSDKDAAIHVAQLYAAMCNMVTQARVTDARLGWFLFLMLVQRHKDGVFNERYAMRGVPSWPASSDDTVTFGMLIALAIKTADPETRQAHKAEITFGTIPKASVRERMQVIYNA